MAGTNFKNDSGDGVVTADGFETAGAASVGSLAVAGATTLAGATLTAAAKLPVYTVAQANALNPMPAVGSIIYVSNGDTGNPCLAVRSGSSWLRVALGAAIAAS